MVSVTSINTTRSEMAYTIIKMLFLLRVIRPPFSFAGGALLMGTCSSPCAGGSSLELGTCC